MSDEAAAVQHVLIIEDQNLMRLALVRELQDALPASIIHGAANMTIASALLECQRFDLVVIDPGLPGFDPRSPSDRLDIVRMIVEASPEAIHCVVTGSDTDQEWQLCQKLGVAAYLAKNDIKPGSFIDILKEISQNGQSARFTQDSSLTPDFYHSGLTPREQEILDWMRQRPSGITRKELYVQLGNRFGIDASSAERYYKSARAKVLKTGPLPKGL